jgi:hypothetical protein
VIEGVEAGAGDRLGRLPRWRRRQRPQSA